VGILARLLPRRDARPLASGTRADSLGSGIPVGGRWVNPASGLGGPHDRSQIDQYVEGSPVDRTLADALIQYNGPGRRVVAREPQDCTREGFPELTPLEFCEFYMRAGKGRAVRPGGGDAGA